ncbi:hypothetical protein [Streptomyces sp. NBC_01185]|uniref:hypothetical protein n=1 Tax=Streptomyces sp. NBC_01185 TaxID=2903764 RepID=UPI003866D91E|nr:hypothetical protein OG770_09055 [Streptomyces sp. NBC_01185]
MSGSAGGRAEQDLPRQAPRRAADPTSWLTGYRRLNHRYEQRPGTNLALLGLAAALCCYKRLLEPTMQDTG